MNLLFGAGAVLGVDLLVSAAFEAFFSGAQDHLAAARPLTGVHPGRLHVHGAHAGLGRVLPGDVGIVPFAGRMPTFVLPLPARSLPGLPLPGPPRRARERENALSPEPSVSRSPCFSPCPWPCPPPRRRVPRLRRALSHIGYHPEGKAASRLAAPVAPRRALASRIS